MMFLSVVVVALSIIVVGHWLYRITYGDRCPVFIEPINELTRTILIEELVHHRDFGKIKEWLMHPEVCTALHRQKNLIDYTGLGPVLLGMVCRLSYDEPRITNSDDLVRRSRT